MPAASMEAVIAVAGELLRPEARRAFAAAWEWARPRVRTEEEARLMAATLALFSGVQAVVAPRRLRSGVLADLHVTGTRSAPGGPARHHFLVCVTPDGSPPPDAAPGDLCFSAAETRAGPFRCAAHILAELLARLAEA